MPRIARAARHAGFNAEEIHRKRRRRSRASVTRMKVHSYGSNPQGDWPRQTIESADFTQIRSYGATYNANETEV